MMKTEEEKEAYRLYRKQYKKAHNKAYTKATAEKKKAYNKAYKEKHPYNIDAKQIEYNRHYTYWRKGKGLASLSILQPIF